MTELAGAGAAPGQRNLQIAETFPADKFLRRESRAGRWQRKEEQSRQRSTSSAKPGRTRWPKSANRDRADCECGRTALRWRVAHFFAAGRKPAPGSRPPESRERRQSIWTAT